MQQRIKKENVFIYFIDNDDANLRELISGYEPFSSFNIQIYSRSKDFLNDFSKLKFYKKQVNIVFISNNLEINEYGNHVEVIEVLKQVKIISPAVEVILYTDNDTIDTVSLAFHHGVYTAIKKNDNFLLRLENNIKGILSQKNFVLKKQSSILTTELFIIFIILTAIALLILYFFSPDRFII